MMLVIPHLATSELHLFMDLSYHMLLSHTKVCLSFIMVCMSYMKVQNKHIKTQNKTFSSISNRNTSQFHLKIKFISIQHQNFKFNTKCQTIQLSYVWDHTISKILHHDLQSDMGNMVWVSGAKGLSVMHHDCNHDSCMLQGCHNVNVMTSSMQCKDNENTMMSCLHHDDVK